MSERLFIRATKNAYLFINPRGGTLLPQDLWTMPLIGPLSLASVGQQLQKHINVLEGDVMFTSGQKVDRISQDKLAIVKFIFDERGNDEARAVKRTATNARNQKIMEILEDKDDASLRGTSKTKLLAMLNESTDDEDEG